MALPSVTYTFVNNTSASASEVNQNFSDIINSLTDSTKDIQVAAITAAGTLTANGDVNLGNAVTDSITATGRLDSDLLPIADDTHDLGSSSLAFAETHATDTHTYGFTRLGSGNDPIKMKIISGQTGVTGNVTVNHGLTGSKIKNVSLQMSDDNILWYGEGHTNSVVYFDYQQNATNVLITNRGSTLNNTTDYYRITITYIE